MIARGIQRFLLKEVLGRKTHCLSRNRRSAQQETCLVERFSNKKYSIMPALR